ncbi:MAG: hypothetical protein MUP70_02500 [Candidatus Aminicenantes bacterium]|nr:hypothetical protein [Candidatus Aminicenantes bacterium]
MDNFLDIPCLDKKEQEDLIAEIEKSIEEKKKSGLLTEKEIREIEEMRLKPLPDILDVQVVYDPLNFDD